MFNRLVSFFRITKFMNLFQGTLAARVQKMKKNIFARHQAINFSSIAGGQYEEMLEAIGILDPIDLFCPGGGDRIVASMGNIRFFEVNANNKEPIKICPGIVNHTIHTNKEGSFHFLKIPLSG